MHAVTVTMQVDVEETQEPIYIVKLKRPELANLHLLDIVHKLLAPMVVKIAQVKKIVVVQLDQHHIVQKQKTALVTLILILMMKIVD